MEPTRRQQLTERITESGFVRNVIGPRVLEPVTSWYEEHLRSDEQPRAESTPARAADSATIDLTVREAAPSAADGHTPVVEHSSRSLEAARNAERFLAGEPAQRSTGPAITSPAAALAPSNRRSRGGSADVAPTPEPLENNSSPAASTPTPRPAVGGLAGARDIAMRVKARIKHHNLNVVAAGIAFWGLLAIPAVLTATISIYGLVASPDDVEGQIDDALSGVSAEAKEVIGDQLTNITSGNSGGLAFAAVFGIVLALWSASGAIAKLIVTMNTIWEVREDRKFFELRGVAVALTLGAILFFLSTVFLLAIVPAILGETALGDAAKALISIGRFPAMLVFMMIGLSFLYWFGPNRDVRFRLLTWGAFIGTVGWLLLSGVFSLYTTYFASYNETYAAMGSIVVLLLWMFITAFMVLVGAEIDAAREERDEELTAAWAASALLNSVENDRTSTDLHDAV